jgi:hypothetical protein
MHDVYGEGQLSRFQIFGRREFSTATRATAILVIATLIGCSRSEVGKVDQLSRRAHADRRAVPELCRALTKGHVVVIASWQSPESSSITLQDFKKDGQSYIPIFSDEAHFREEAKGSSYERSGKSIDCKLLVSILRGDELLILNPRSGAPVELRQADFKPFIPDGRGD